MEKESSSTEESGIYGDDKGSVNSQITQWVWEVFKVEHPQWVW
jgi:hypothetical protein